MSQQEQTLRNPSQQEIEALLNKNNIPKAQIIKDSEISKPIEYKSGVENTSSIPMKPQDDFEPDPLPFKLPSGKKVIHSKYLTENNEIFVRKLSLKEEGFFAEISSGKDFYSGMNRILRECIKTDIHENTLSAIDKIPLIIFILAISFCIRTASLNRKSISASNISNSSSYSRSLSVFSSIIDIPPI